MAKPVKLTGAQAAARVGVKQSTWRAYESRGQCPARDGECDPCGCPWWWDTTIDEFVASRARKA